MLTPSFRRSTASSGNERKYSIVRGINVVLVTHDRICVEYIKDYECNMVMEIHNNMVSS